MIRGFLSLSTKERADTIFAALRLVTAKVLLTALGAARTQRLLHRQFQRVDRDRAAAIARAVQRAARHVPLPTNCLDRATSLAWALSREGLASTMRIGVRKHADGLAGHAWIEHDGEPLLDDESAHFVPLGSA